MLQNILPNDPVIFPSALPAKMEETITAFATITGVPVTFFDMNMEAKWECLPQNKICNLFDIYKTPGSVCRQNLTSSAGLVAKLGEPYIFVCRSGFVKIVVAVMLNGKQYGSFMAGPLSMGEVKASTISSMFKLNGQTPETSAKVVDFLRKMKPFEPKEVSALASLLNAAVLSCIAHNTVYTQMQSEFKVQSDIGESLQRYKKQNKPIHYPYDLENELLKKIKAGDTKGAKQILGVLLNEISIVEAGNLPFIRTKVFELCAVLSREIMENDSSFQDFFDLQFDYINSLNEVDNIEDLTASVTKLVDSFSEMVSKSLYSGNSDVISQAVRYIGENYTRKLTLKDVADTLHINESYFSTLFKHEMGVTFTQYLSNIRVKRSKHYLVTTQLSMVEVAFHSGFEDQSYFTKVFKKMVGCTPNHYRKRAQSGALREAQA